MILLASKSPQRKKILEKINVSFDIGNCQFDESLLKAKLKSQNLHPVEIVSKLAYGKLKSAITQNDSPKYAMVLTADTMLYPDDSTVFGKPKSATEAKKMLRRYTTEVHHVVTAIAGYNPKTSTSKTLSSSSAITFKNLSNSEIERLVASCEWQNAAGAYRIQGLASMFIKKIEGSYSGIVGLPTHEFYCLIQELKVNLDEVFN